MKPTNPTISALGTTIFTTMSALAVEHKAVNLGQGFPDGNGPDDVRGKAAEYLSDQPNQYPPMMGVPALRQAVAAHNKRFYGLDVDWQREVMVTSGATEALTACFLSLIAPGDEVILIEPLYDSYLPIVRLAGGIPKFVRLTPPRWELPREELAAAFTSKTKLIALNSPLNPAGKVFSRDELAFIATLVERHDAYALCDEVYEHITFDGTAHIPLMTFPGMRERCLRVGSAGKTFSLTGWKIGYVTGGASLMASAGKAHQFITFTSAPNLQRAVAYGLGKDDAYFKTLASDLQAKRDFLAAGLKDIGFDVLSSAGTYFLTVDIRPLAPNDDDVSFCKRITAEAGVAAIPISAFYENAPPPAGNAGDSNKGGGPPPRHFVRFAFCKEASTLEEALARLRKYFKR